MTVNPKSQHVNDPLLQPFLNPTFSPTDYLNHALLPLHIAASNQSTKSPQALSLSELTSQTQSHITQLSAQTSRLSDTLTQLTDDILRSGSRLAYEVEVLRGEALSLQETLSDTLQEDVKKFLPKGLLPTTPTQDGSDQQQETTISLETPALLDASARQDLLPDTVPPSISHLRTLHQVRTRLQSVTAIFDAALSWPLPPSHLSTANPPSSLISVSAPTPPSQSSSDPNSAASLEEQGQAALQRLKQEISDLQGGEEGIVAAEAKVAELRQLAGVWKGTGEEKARRKVVEGLEKMIAERRKREEGERGRDVAGAAANLRDEERGKKEGSRGPGFLRRLRDEIYLE